MQHLAKGFRALRLGHAALALNDFVAAEETLTTDREKVRARLGRIIATRLSGTANQTASLIASTKEDLPTLTAEEQLEIEWEEICWAARQSGDLSDVLRAVQKGQPHHVAVYVLEALFWSHAVKSRAWMDKLPQVAYLARQDDLNLRKPSRATNSL